MKKQPLVEREKIPDEHLYLQVAEGLEKLIADEVLQIGDKLPSVRVLSRENGISMGTAFQAFYHLEGKGLIESRPKSGYYVLFNYKRYRELPGKMQPDTPAHDVSVNEMIDSIYGDIVSDNVLNFALAVPDASLLPGAKMNKSVTYALRNSNEHCLNYENTQGNIELRQQVAKLCFNWGGKIKPEEVIITAGCLEAVILCLKAVTEPGDTVAVESPTYFGINQAIESLGLKVKEISTDPETGIDLNYLEDCFINYRVKACVFIPSFNNPFGSCMPDENKKKLVELITQYQIPLVEDDIYGDLYFGKNRPKTCKYYDKEGMVLYCSSLSKSLSPGYRTGWTIPGKYFEKVRQLKRIHNISCATLPQAALAHFLKHGRYEYHLKKLRKALHTQCLRYMQAIIQYFPSNTRVSRPQGGFILWLELAVTINAFKLRTEAMRHGISIVPGKIFSTGNDYSNCIRISFGKPWNKEVEDGLKLLGDLVRDMENEH